MKIKSSLWSFGTTASFIRGQQAQRTHASFYVVFDLHGSIRISICRSPELQRDMSLQNDTTHTLKRTITIPAKRSPTLKLDLGSDDLLIPLIPVATDRAFGALGTRTNRSPVRFWERGNSWIVLDIYSSTFASASTWVLKHDSRDTVALRR